MRELRVKQFSSMKCAELSFRPLTLIIGPQASGKSVLCKLAYFFTSILQDATRHISDGDDFEVFKEAASDRFLRLFPVGTWGVGKFEIFFTAGPIDIRVVRSIYAGKVNDRFNIKFSASLTEFYSDNLKQANTLLGGTLDDLGSPLGRFRIQEAVQQSLSKLMGNDYVPSQLFVPAARSFFTSIGKAVAAFENSNSLDELTLEFGRVFSGRLEHGQRFPNRNKIEAYIARMSKELLTGTLTRVKGREYLETPDGRRLPLSSMSSGQQELLPLLQVLPRSVSNFRRIMYIEEPEAHLFPDAQSLLVEVLSTLMSLYESKTDIVLTTHSPYVVSKFNNLIKAGQLGDQETRRSKTAEILPSPTWVHNDELAAFAIHNGELENILTTDGLIDGDYLDSISTSNSQEFSRLLGVEFA